MKIVVCGTMVPAEIEKDIYQLSNAANRFLLNFYNELRQEHDVVFFSYLGIDITEAVWEKLCADTSEIRYFRKTPDKITGIMQYKKAVTAALKEADCVITYNTVYAWLFAPGAAKAMGKKSALILADYTPVDGYQKIAGKAYAWLQAKVMRQYDFVIGLSQKTRKYLSDKQRFVYVAGGINQSVYDYFGGEDVNKSELTTLMYAGVLEPVTGIDMLIRAFTRLENNNIRLAISGKGSLESTVKAAAEADSRIRFLGCPPYEEYLQNLRSADVLINPRNMTLPENQNNFPSKIMEYLATGKPIISTKFPGWEAFDEVICFCESTESQISEVLEAVCSGEVHFKEKEQIRQTARKFLWSSQVKRITEMMSEG